MATMNELNFYELFGEIDPEIILAADRPVPFRQKRGFKIILIAASLALVMLLTPIAGALALVGSYKVTHPDFEGGPIKVVDQILEDNGVDLPDIGGGGLLNIDWAAIPEVISPDGNIDWGALGAILRGDDPSETIGVQDYTAVKLDDGTMMIMGYSGNEETVTVPDEIDGVPVTVIGEGAFAKNQTVKHVILPDSVTTIQREAFASCSNLILVKIPQNLQEIGDYAFSDCASLSELYADWSSSTYMGANLPYSLHTLGEQAFSNCQSLTMVVIRPTLASWGVNTFIESGLRSAVIMDGVSEIPDNAFAGTRLTEVELPSSVTKIGAGAFANCDQLHTVTLNEGLEIIANSAFSGTAISEITIPSTVTALWGMDFAECKNLTSVIFKGDVPSALFNKEYGSGVYLPEYTVYYTLGAKGFDDLERNGYTCELMPCKTDSVVLDCGFEPIDFYKATILGTNGQSLSEQDVMIVDTYAESKKMRSLLTKLDNNISYSIDYFEDFTVIIVQVTHSSSEEILGIAGIGCADVIYSGVVQQNPTDYHLYPVIKVDSGELCVEDLQYTYIAIEIAKTDKNFVDSHIYAYNVNPDGIEGSVHHDALPYGK